MSTNWRWQYRRWQLQRRENMPWYLKLQFKVIHLFRRIGIVVFTIFWKKYRRDTPLRLEDISSILFIPNGPIGDVLLTSPMWRALKKRKPSIKIGVMVGPKNKSTIQFDPNVTMTYNLFAERWMERLSEVLRARRDGWDVVATTVGFFRPLRYGVLTRLIARNGVTATMHDSRSERYHNIYSFCFKRPWLPFPQPMIEQFESLMERTFDFVFDDSERDVLFYYDREVLSNMEKRLHTLREETTTDTIIQINLEAKRDGMEWGMENVWNLAQKILSNYPSALVLLTSTKHYRTSTQFYMKSIERVQNFDLTSTHELAALAHYADLVITPDTAVSHLAAAAKTPVIGLYGQRNEWMPYRSRSIILTANEIGVPKLKPVSTIPVEAVMDAVRSFLVPSSGENI